MHFDDFAFVNVAEDLFGVVDLIVLELAFEGSFESALIDFFITEFMCIIEAVSFVGAQ